MYTPSPCAPQVGNECKTVVALAGTRSVNCQQPQHGLSLSCPILSCPVPSLNAGSFPTFNAGRHSAQQQLLPRQHAATAPACKKRASVVPSCVYACSPQQHRTRPAESTGKGPGQAAAAIVDTRGSCASVRCAHMYMSRAKGAATVKTCSRLNKHALMRHPPPPARYTHMTASVAHPPVTAQALAMNCIRMHVQHTVCWRLTAKCRTPCALWASIQNRSCNPLAVLSAPTNFTPCFFAEGWCSPRACHCSAVRPAHMQGDRFASWQFSRHLWLQLCSSVRPALRVADTVGWLTAAPAS